MGKIKALSESLIGKIAAGEVVERPAAAVEELVENSLDAGATAVTVEIREGGLNYIRVADNGCGIDESDIRMAFERHATSKISREQDLSSIATLGFRGEALASIAAVAQVELTTRRKEDEVGTKIRIEGSKVIEQLPKPASVGTNFTVKNLFFNVPARRNFLKSNEAELRHINEEFCRITIMNPEIGFTFVSNDKELFHLYPGTLKQRIVGLFGKDYDSKLLPVNQVTETVTIDGFIVKPEFSKKTRGEQYFFVNRRFIKHAYLHHAVENAYKELIPQDCFPGYFLDIQIDPKEIDINIHPTKTEVNFIDVKLIYAIMHSAVRKAIGQNNLAPTLDFDINPNMGIDFGEASRMDRPVVTPKVDFDPSFNPFKISPIRHQQQNWRIAYDNTNDIVANTRFEDNTSDNKPYEEEQKSLFIQLQQSYIVTAVKSGILVVDQHLAHERILYEKYLKEMETEVIASQQELFPHHISLNINDASILKELKPELEKIGFRIESMNNTTFVINGTPIDCKGSDAVSIIEKILEDYKTNLSGNQSDRKLNLARSLASQMAVKAGQTLSSVEMQDIIDRLFGCAVSEVAPNGKKIFTIINADDIKTRLN